MSVTQSWAMLHHSISLLPRTNAVGSPDQRKDHGDFGLMAADMGEVTDVSLELIPVALVGKADDGVELLARHQLTHPRPAPLAFHSAEFT